PYSLVAQGCRYLERPLSVVDGSALFVETDHEQAGQVRQAAHEIRARMICQMTQSQLERGPGLRDCLLPPAGLTQAVGRSTGRQRLAGPHKPVVCLLERGRRLRLRAGEDGCI